MKTVPPGELLEYRDGREGHAAPVRGGGGGGALGDVPNATHALGRLAVGILRGMHWLRP